MGAAPIVCSGELTLECFGACIRVDADDDAVLRSLERRLPPAARLSASASADVSYQVRRAEHPAMPFTVFVSPHEADEDACLGHAPHARAAADVIADDLEFRIALQAPEHLFVHAAAVLWRGRAIGIPGPSHSGKSTLTAAFLRAGATYLSDEFIILDAAGLVHPFRRPVHLRTAEAVRRVPVPRARLAPDGPHPLGLVVHTWYEPTAIWQPREVPRGSAALSLLENTVVACTRPRFALERIATALERGTLGTRGPRGDADVTARAVLAWAAHAWHH